MVSFRAGLMGSIRAWLPSRRSVDNHRGAWVMLRLGQARSGRLTGWNGVYRWQGMPLGCCRTGAYPAGTRPAEAG